MQVRAVPKVQIYSREFELSTKPPTRVLFDLISPPNPPPLSLSCGCCCCPELRRSADTFSCCRRSQLVDGVTCAFHLFIETSPIAVCCCCVKVPRRRKQSFLSSSQLSSFFPHLGSYPLNTRILPFCVCFRNALFLLF